MNRIVIESIRSERPFGVIFSGRLDDGSVIRVKAPRKVLVSSPLAGEIWDIAGSIEPTAWGPQITADKAVRQMPSGSLIRAYLARHVAGIGPERAARLWQAYGLDLGEALLQGDLEALGAVIAPERPTLGPLIAASVVRAWRKADAEVKLVTWLQGLGVDDMRVVRRISTILGEKAVTTLQRNPWCLTALLPWSDVDRLGCRLLAEAGDEHVLDTPDRLVGAVDAVMKALIATGATATSRQELRSRIASALDVNVAHSRTDRALAFGIQHGAVLAGPDDTWRAPGCALMEEAVLKRLRALALPDSVPASPVAAADFPAALNAYERHQSALHPEQRAAVLKVLALRFACLRGGAGVGKTHVTRAICTLWEQAGGDVVLAALAGKAALRLSRATGRLARTLFRTIAEIDERRTSGDRHSADRDLDDNPSRDRSSELAEITPRSLVIVDEASMVDLATLYALLKRMPEGARLLLVGDERQLPPVGFGLIFHRIVADTAVTASLTVIHRQTDASGIPSVAAALRERRMPPLRPYQGRTDGVFLMEASDKDAIAQGVMRAHRDLELEDVLVVVPTKAGAAGLQALNKALHERHGGLHPLVEIEVPFGDRISEGEPVVYGRNNYARGLFNGSMGIARAVTPSTLVAEFDGKEQLFEGADLLDISLGYALTCHRVQGSQAGRVIVALPQTRLLDPSWLYTAVTRSERQVVLVGDEATIAQALARDWAANERHVGFRW